MFLSDRVSAQKKGISASDKAIASLKKELNDLKQQKSDRYLRDAIRDRDGRGTKFKDFCDKPHECDHPHHHRDPFLRNMMNNRREERFIRNVMEGKIDRVRTFKTPNKPERKVSAPRPEKKDITDSARTLDKPIDLEKTEDISIKR